MTKAEKRALIENRLKVIKERGKDSKGIIRKLQRSAGLFQNRADKCAEDNDDTDGCEGSRKTRADHTGNLGQGNSRHNSQQQGNPHDCQERMNLQFGNQKNHRGNGNHKSNNQRQTSHTCLPPLMFNWIFLPYLYVTLNPC